VTFPDTRFSDITAYSDAYFKQYIEASSSIDQTKLAKAADILLNAYKNLKTLFVCGNGGSASISNHLACDHGKLLATDTDLQPRVQSLSTNIEVITAIANDISYDQVFVHQLKLSANPGDILMTVSSSGDSENVVQAAQWAREFGLDVISMTGFLGGRTAKISNVNLHVDGDNYGVIEDVHQSLMHLLGQYLRQLSMDEELIQKRNF
jgi:D-sedoheptulose 7-phosphate isomerase